MYSKRGDITREIPDFMVIGDIKAGKTLIPR